jgi:hypothetical protein
MAKEFKFKADFSSLLRGASLQKAMNAGLKASQTAWGKLLDLNKKYEEQTKAINQSINQKRLLMKRLDQEGASPLRKRVEGMRASFDIFKTGIKNPFGLLIGGAAHLKTALMAVGKVVWLQLLIGAIVILKKMWDANLGGIQRHWFRIVGAFQNGVGGIMAAFMRFVQKVTPIVEPFLEGMANLIIPIIDNVMTMVSGFLDSGDAVSTFNEIFQPILFGLTELLSTLIPIISDIIQKFTQAGPTGENSLGKVFKAFGKVLGAVLSLVAKIIDVLDAFGLFDAAVFIIKLIAEGISTVVDFVVVLVEWINVAIEGFKKLLFWRKEDNKEAERGVKAEEARAAAVQTTAVSKEEALSRSPSYNSAQSTVVNNSPVVNVHSSGPITPGSAPMIGDILSKSVSIDQVRM